MATVIARSIKRRFYVRYEIVDADGASSAVEARADAPDPNLITPPPGTVCFRFFLREEGYETTDDGETRQIRGEDTDLPDVYDVTPPTTRSAT